MPVSTLKVQRPLADVQGKTAFVTGGSSGIGLGIVRALLDAGMKVAFSYKSEANRDAALASLPQENPGLHAIRLDTTDRDAMPRAADEVERRFGNVHLVVNNAGIGVPALLSNVSWQDWDWSMDVNVNGIFNGVRTFLPRLQAHGEGGHIVATSSSAGIVAGTLGVYATAKFAVVGMMESLRTEMEGSNIGVSVFCPGLVRSSIFDIERNRPAAHGSVSREPPKPPPLKPGARPIDIMAAAMDPLEAGRQVLDGVRRNDLYILSHPEFEPVVRQRVTLMLASFSKKAVPADRRMATAAITPDIYAAELAKKGLLQQQKNKASKARAKKPAANAAPKPARKRVAKGVRKVARQSAKKQSRKTAARRARRR
jgi:NAD(P)-dependent dehydrogenase (short-subunit alcohol dehydrogenase family)